MQSGIAGLQWPPIMKASNAQLVALVAWLEASQWLDAKALESGQLRQLAILLKHFERQSVWLQQRIALHGQSAQELCQSMQAFAQLPVTERGDLQQAGTDFHSRIVPPAHQPIAPKKTSGSTGEPVMIYRTAVNQLFWLATTLREHLWHGRDARGTLAVVRANLAQPFEHMHWGAPVASVFDTGTAYGMPVTTNTKDLVTWLHRIQPHYLLIYPSVWAAVLEQLQDTPSLDRLVQVRTLGETLSESLRCQTHRQLGISIADTYSSEEVGTIAIQCPHSGLYHTQDEGLIVEVLAPDRQPCKAGEVGRVVVTDLLNFASPIIRYDIGDYAEAGAACSCGRGLRTLRRVLGRQRNMVKLPGGRSHWPLTGFHDFGNVANITQYQFVQKSLDLIEVRLVIASEQSLSTEQEQSLAEIISQWMKHRFEYRFVYYPKRIPKSASGKFEEFMCEI
jgi:phenylacetate-CoA ligase